MATSTREFVFVLLTPVLPASLKREGAIGQDAVCFAFAEALLFSLLR
jgi:hypothetical protein